MINLLKTNDYEVNQYPQKNVESGAILHRCLGSRK